MKFKNLQYGAGLPIGGRNIAYLRQDNWDDFGFKTLFTLIVFNHLGEKITIGQVKIGFAGQTSGWTAHQIPAEFDFLPSAYFSLGQDAEYYKNIEALPGGIKTEVLIALRDVVADVSAFSQFEDEKAFTTSLLRSTSYSAIQGQFSRILQGGAEQTSYDFVYKVLPGPESAGIELRFEVRPDSKPATNIHVLIGRNGIGKTTLLNGMISALVGSGDPDQRGFGAFWDMEGFRPKKIENNYFTALVSVSFSAFDPFDPPMDNEDPEQHIKYCYVGLKKVVVENNAVRSEHKNIEKFAGDFVRSLANCFSLEKKKERWLRAIRFLESDANFAEMDLTRLAYDENLQQLKGFKRKLFEKMSSGHAIILLTITKLVEKVDEKTLVLMDEPESHLHPPLLSAFTRALADLLTNRNGVAIIATHSPVILQEVPRECVWKLRRNGLIANADRPEQETFGENVGVLTREVFQLEVSKSGFHDLLARAVDEGKTFDAIVGEYSGKIGFEGQAVLRALISAREEGRA
ncbi:AAA family ATPase [Telluria sp. B2]